MYRILSLLILVIIACNDPKKAAPTENTSGYALVIHGGAGTIERTNMDTLTEQSYIASLNAALDAGESILKEGGKSIDAVIAVIELLENNPLFNAGKGAVFTNEGTNEMDASIMDGETQKAGAVGAVTNIKNPIKLARKIMDNSPHVMMVGKGAENFARLNGLEMVDPSYFYTEKRWDDLKKQKTHEKFGTVGCVARDKYGNIVAGTSTGGMTNKKHNRLGDTPIIGAGTFADNNTCGVSCTGHGEYFIRYTVARDIAALMEYKGLTLKAACDLIVHKKLVEKGGEGGLIAIDKFGNIEMPFNTSGMYRGFAKPGKRKVEIYK